MRQLIDVNIDEILSSWGREYLIEESVILTYSDIYDILKVFNIRFDARDDILQLFQDNFGLYIKSV